MASSRFKVVLLGEGRVGKTSILLRFVRGEYTDKQKSTLQASCVAPSPHPLNDLVSELAGSGKQNPSLSGIGHRY